jgi:hypothetical protein
MIGNSTDTYAPYHMYYMLHSVEGTLVVSIGRVPSFLLSVISAVIPISNVYPSYICHLSKMNDTHATDQA